MNLLQRFELWGDRHHPKWLDIVRIALGIFLFYKGIDVLRNMSETIGLMSSTAMHFNSFFLVLVGHFIVIAHLMGGILLILGVHTRFASITQIPILVGAIFFINYSRNTIQPFSELIVPIIVLLLLICFLIVGNGPWSFAKMDEEDENNR